MTQEFQYVSASRADTGVIPAGTKPKVTENGDGTLTQHVKLDSTTDAPQYITAVGDGYISTGNTYEGALAAGATFEGTFDNCIEYGGIRISAYSDKASATRGLEFWCSKDGANGFIDDSYTVPAATAKTYAAPVSAPYFKVRYTNNSTDTAAVKICVMFLKNMSVVSSHRLGDNVTDDDDAQLNKVILSAQRPDTEYHNINSSINGNLFVGIGDVQADAGGRVRVSQFTTLGDYKVLNYDHALLLENAGTGTGTYSGNKYDMSVTSAQWRVRVSRRHHQYFSGKSQAVEATFDNFQPQAGTLKRVGYFSSSTVSPYSDALDGFWLENDGTTITLKAARAGTETLSKVITEWDGYQYLNSYQSLANWENFTVVLFDFLWLGGAILRLWIKTHYGFVLAHTFNYSGTAKDVFILSPNQPVRYEIRSTFGTGSLRYICAQVSTEGSTTESGMSRSVNTGATGIVMATIGTKYPLIAVRNSATAHDSVTKIDGADILVSTNNDLLLWTLEINPTLSAALTYGAVANSAIDSAVGNGVITVTGAGTVIASGYITQGSPFPSEVLKDNFLAYLGGTLAGVSDEYVLCVTPVTAGVTTFGALTVKEY